MEHQRIDVHQHVVPPAYAEWLRSKGVRDAGGRELPQWSLEDTLRLMDGHEIATAVLSVSTPGVHPDSCKRARCGGIPDCNNICMQPDPNSNECPLSP